MAQNAETIKKQFPVTGMTCAGCASSVEQALKKQKGVLEATVNLADHTVRVSLEGEVDERDLKEALKNTAYDLIMVEDDATEAHEAHQEKEYENHKTRTLGAALFTLPVFVLGMFFMEWIPGKWISLVLSIPVLFFFGRSFYIRAFQQAKSGTANMDTLVALSTGIAFLFSLVNTIFPEFLTERGIQAHVYYEAATVIIVFVSLGKLLEAKARSSTSSTLKKLIGLQPQTVIVLKDGQETEKQVKELVLGEYIRVKPGQRIPVDGSVVEGVSHVDESTLNGEPIPSVKEPGDLVFAGTINQEGTFIFAAEKLGEETLLGQIIERVKEAQGSKAPVQKTVDKVASIFVPTILLLAIITFIIWVLTGHENALAHGLMAAVSVLVIACPCALGLATPTAIVVGIGLGAENNILIKDAESLELGKRVDVVVLDKTGTITQGKPKVAASIWESDALREETAPVLLAMEQRASHPLTGAIVESLNNIPESVDLPLFETIPGKGIEALGPKVKRYIVGSHDWMVENKLSISDKLQGFLERHYQQGNTTVFFGNGKQVLAVFALQDPIKESSPEAIKRLHQLGIDTYLLSGDHKSAVEVVAKKVGITIAKGACLPGDKEAFVKELQEQGKTVAMVGDGINDTQAMAQADVSMAMGHGTDIAMDVARITLLSSDLRDVAKSLVLSRKIVAGLRQNLFWAFIYNIVGIPIAAGLLYPINGFLLNPMIAGAAMAFSSVSVMANSLRIRMMKL